MTTSMPTDFSKCKVYKLVHVDPSSEVHDMYVGSTCCSLNTRISGHRTEAMTKQSNVYKWMRDVGIDNVTIVLISEHPECTSFEYQRRVEREAVDRLQPSLNMRRPYVTVEERREYHNNHREAILADHRRYYKANHVARCEYQQQYYKANRENRNEYNRQYYQANIETLLDYHRQYSRQHYEANREAINERRRQRRAAKKAQQSA